MVTVWRNQSLIMNRKQTVDLIHENSKELELINHQRRLWLFASSVVFSSIIILVFAWDWLEGLHSKSIWWVIISLMLILSVNWWYWTMRVILKLLHHQKIEFHIIHELVEDIKELKKDIKVFAPKDVDKDK